MFSLEKQADRLLTGFCKWPHLLIVIIKHFVKIKNNTHNFYHELLVLLTPSTKLITCVRGWFTSVKEGSRLEVKTFYSKYDALSTGLTSFHGFIYNMVIDIEYITTVSLRHDLKQRGFIKGYQEPSLGRQDHEKEN